MPENYLRIQNMYEDSKTLVRCVIRVTDQFRVRVGQ